MLTRPPSAGWCKTSNATVISFGSGPLVLAALRRTMPDRERPFRVWGGDAIPLLAFYSANMIVYWAERVGRRRGSGSRHGRLMVGLVR